MVAARLWLVLDGGVVVGDVAYTDRGEAEHDAEVLRAEACEALGCPVAPGQIEVRGVRVLTDRRYGADPAQCPDGSTPTACATRGPETEVDPFAPPAGHRAMKSKPAPSKTTASPYYVDPSQIDPFAVPGGHPPLAGPDTSTPPWDSSTGSTSRTDRGAKARRHLRVVH
jgi:hypothetical protein